MNNETAPIDGINSARLLRDFAESGFVTLENAISQGRLKAICATYDEIMKPNSGSDLKAGSTTDRLYFNNEEFFNDIHQHPLLLAICGQLIAHPVTVRSIVGRTVRAGSLAQALHVDVAADSADAPVVGFILMLDPFTPSNGATRFVPGSHLWHVVGSDRRQDVKDYREVMACGSAGSMIIFDASVWHGHSANRTSHARRSIQGYLGVRKEYHSYRKTDREETKYSLRLDRLSAQSIISNSLKLKGFLGD